MIGRVYTWRGDTWRVLIRWQGRGPRNVLIERVRRCRFFPDDDCAMYVCGCANTGWIGTGEKVVRPFRGLRRLR